MRSTSDTPRHARPDARPAADRLARRCAPPGARPGFTVVEVLLALLLLSFMVLGFQAATGEIIHYAAQSDRQAVAVQLVEDRLDLVRLDPDYEALVLRYAESDRTLAEYPGLRRTTVAHRTRELRSTGLLDYVTLTVTVGGESLRRPVSRTIVVGSP